MEKKPRRSHAERSAETKDKIIQAVVDLIAEYGIQKTTANAIAKRAGVTWGALQHHFGGKYGALAATLEDSFERFSATIGEPTEEIKTLDLRIDQFIDRAWEHYRSPHYKSMFSLLSNDLSDIYEAAEWKHEQMRLFESLDRVWLTFFPLELQDDHLRKTVAHYTHSVLTGLAMTHNLWATGKQTANRELALLKKSLLEVIDEK